MLQQLKDNYREKTHGGEDRVQSLEVAQGKVSCPYQKEFFFFFSKNN